MVAAFSFFKILNGVEFGVGVRVSCVGPTRLVNDRFWCFIRPGSAGVFLGVLVGSKKGKEKGKPDKARVKCEGVLGIKISILLFYL